MKNQVFLIFAIVAVMLSFASVYFDNGSAFRGWLSAGIGWAVAWNNSGE